MVKSKCPFDKFCLDKDCGLTHSKVLCRNKECSDYFCTFRHTEKKLLCVDGRNCKNKENCQSLHPKDGDYCKHEENCFNQKCTKAHTRAWCSFAGRCNNYHCTNRHPKDRKAKCSRAGDCNNKKCNFLHPNASLSSSPLNKK